MSNTDLNGRVAVVTGGGRGIGRATALTLAKMGAKVVVNDLGGSMDGVGKDIGPAQQVVNEIKANGGKAVANGDSVADYDAAKRIIDTAIKEFGKIDILVNNAGTTTGAPIWELDPKVFQAVVGVHVFGTFNCTRHAAPYMKDQKYGRIVNIVSRAGLWGSPGASPYAAGKGGIFGFTNSVCRDLLPFNVMVNGVNPSAAATRMVTTAIERAKERGMDPKAAERMLAVAQDPLDVAAVISFLSTEACNITGQYFFVQGGSLGLFQPLTVTKTAFKEGRWTAEELARVVPKFDIQPLRDLY
ncbi:MAG: SDR family NAD(P)-dependent oxidoreductase [Chloroflexi bacterium]|nr:SDR family NAD(P)-dependent oxidoreductase [Chloroflexota bacterium]